VQRSAAAPCAVSYATIGLIQDEHAKNLAAIEKIYNAKKAEGGGSRVTVGHPHYRHSSFTARARDAPFLVLQAVVCPRIHLGCV
jgi:hypothetical protein